MVKNLPAMQESVVSNLRLLEACVEGEGRHLLDGERD